MTKIEMRGGTVGDSADWNDAFKVISHLAEARAATLREIEGDERASPAPAHQPAAAAAPGSEAPSPPDQLARDMAEIQLARDVAEIERAAAALRRAEPTLEPRVPESQEASGETRSSRSVWMLVGVIWMTAVLVVACTIGAVVLLFA